MRLVTWLRLLRLLIEVRRVIIVRPLSWRPVMRLVTRRFFVCTVMNIGTVLLMKRAGPLVLLWVRRLLVCLLLLCYVNCLVRRLRLDRRLVLLILILDTRLIVLVVFCTWIVLCNIVRRALLRLVIGRHLLR